MREKESNVLLCLTAKAVKSAALPLQSIDHIHGGDGLPLGMLGVGDSIPDDVFQEHLQHTAGLLVDQARYPLHSSTSGQTSDGRFGDPLDVVAENFPVPLGSSLPETFATFATTSHCSAAGVLLQLRQINDTVVKVDEYIS